MLALSGDMPRKLQGTDHIQTTAPDLVFRDVSLYSETISAPAQAPAVIHQAIAAAYAGRGVAHLMLPQDVIGGSAQGAVSSVATLRPPPERAAGEADLAELARRIDQAGGVVIMCGAGCHGAVNELRAVGPAQGAIDPFGQGQGLMPFGDPRWMGGIGMIGTRPVYHAVMHCDLLLMVGTDYPYSEFLPRKGTVVQIDERPQALGRRAPTALGVVGSVGPTLKLLLDRVAAKTDTSFLEHVTKERRSWDAMLDEQADPARSPTGSTRRRWRAPSATWRRAMRCSCWTPGSTRYGPPTGFARAARSGSSDRSTMRRSGRRLARPTASRRWTGRARSSRCAATAASTC